jgi:Mrp family chromosome partitioning ATPase
MSNYFQTLKRLEREQAQEKADAQRPRARVEPVAAPEPALGAASSSSSKVVPASDPPRTQAPRIIEQPAVVDERLVGGFSALYDNLRAIGNGAPVGTFVIAGASAGEAVDRVTAGLAAEIARNDIRVLVAELYRSAGHPMLRVRMATPTEKSEAGRYGTNARRRTDAPAVTGDLPKPTRLDLQGGPVPASLRDWLDLAHAEHQVVIVQAPPLGITIDAAMVARASDGLLLAVEANATPREALRQCIERADTVGCQVLGIVMEGRPEWRPRWLRRLAAMRNLF